MDKRLKRQKMKDQKKLAKALPVFGDRRLEEVARLLRWTRPVVLRMPDTHEGSELPSQEIQAQFCLAAAARTQSLPLGDALFSFMTKPAASNEVARGENINLGVHIQPFKLHLELSAETLPPERRCWPDFHAGVAAALERDNKEQFDYTEISYNRPNELNARHAGYLYGLGLMGHMRSMAVYQAFSYLDPKHEPTSIGVLLGLSTAFMGTGDSKITSVLAVHLAALHPPNSADLQLSVLVQAAGILGLGLLYLGTKKQSVADIFIREFGKITVQNMEQAEAHRETYALMNGFAFGLVMLGEGKAKAGMGDAALLRQFRTFVDGDGQSPLPGSKKGVQPAVDVNITSPAATVALSLMYLGTCRQDVIDLFEIPQSSSRLDYVRPSLVMFRIIGRALIAFPQIECSQAWIDSLIPKFLRQAYDMDATAFIKTMSTDMEASYWSVVAGACFAIALKFAGTASAEAHTLLLKFYDKLCKAVTSKGVLWSNS
jgi:anaphase-promoting complex subunit 1